MANDEYRSPFLPEDMVIINLNKYSGIMIERDNLRKFHKMILHAETPITAEEIENILEAARLK